MLSVLLASLVVPPCHYYPLVWSDFRGGKPNVLRVRVFP